MKHSYYILYKNNTWEILEMTIPEMVKFAKSNKEKIHKIIE